MSAPADRPRMSRLRLALLRLRDEAVRLLEVFLAREPLLRGSVYELRRKCGRPSCHCAEGEPHATWVLATSGPRGRRLRTLPPSRLPEVRRRAERSRRFRRARARLVQVHRQILAFVDQLEEARRKEG